MLLHAHQKPKMGGYPEWVAASVWEKSPMKSAGRELAGVLVVFVADRELLTRDRERDQVGDERQGVGEQTAEQVIGELLADRRLDWSSFWSDGDPTFGLGRRVPSEGSLHRLSFVSRPGSPDRIFSWGCDSRGVRREA